MISQGLNERGGIVTQGLGNAPDAGGVVELSCVLTSACVIGATLDAPLELEATLEAGSTIAADLTAIAPTPPPPTPLPPWRPPVNEGGGGGGGGGGPGYGMVWVPRPPPSADERMREAVRRVLREVASEIHPDKATTVTQALVNADELAWLTSLLNGPSGPLVALPEDVKPGDEEASVRSYVSWLRAERHKPAKKAGMIRWTAQPKLDEALKSALEFALEKAAKTRKRTLEALKSRPAPSSLVLEGAPTIEARPGSSGRALFIGALLGGLFVWWITRPRK